MRTAVKWIAWIICLLTGMLISLKSLREPDIWWMLKTGEWMIQNKSFVTHDIFSFTFAGAEWISVKWLFELLLVCFKKIGGPEFTIVIQTIVNTALIIFLLKQFNQFNKIINPESSGTPTAAIIIATYLFIFSTEFRMVGRPEMVTHLMVAIFSFLLISYRSRPSTIIYWVVPLQIVWANAHEAYGVGAVMLIAAPVIYLLERYYYKRNKLLTDLIFPKHLIIASILAIMGISLNPNGPKMIIHPLNIFQQTQSNKFTSELLSFTKEAYWNIEAYINVAIFIIVIYLLLFKFRKAKVKRPFFRWVDSKFGLGYTILLMLFFYLSLTMYRNIPVFIIFSIPLLAMGLEILIKYLMRSFKTVRGHYILYGGLIIVGLLIYGYVGTGEYFKKFNSREEFGVKVNRDYHPVGAANFIRDHNIQGTCFSDYLTSSYLLWSLYPQFKTYIDLRDLDIFDEGFFREFINMSYDPQLLAKKDSLFNFSYAILYRPQFRVLHKYLYSHNNWDLVYLDPITAVYLKNTSANKIIIEKFGLKRNEKDIFNVPVKPTTSSVATFITQLFWPFYNEDEPTLQDYDRAASFYYMSIQRIDLAIQRAESSVNSGIDPWLGYELLGNTYFELASTISGPEKLGYLARSETAFKRSLQDQAMNPGSYFGLGLIYMERKKWGEAMYYFKECVKIDDEHLNAFISMADCQNNLSNKFPEAARRYLLNWVTYIEKAQELNPNNPMIRLQLGIGYCRLGDCKKATKQFKDVLDFPGLPKADVEFARDCLERCGPIEN